jgi:translation initiation factor IF-3
VPEVRVVGPEGEMLGVLPTQEALRLAREKDLDLVEVNPKAMPPVCKIMDYGRYKYEEKKRENDTKKRALTTELKEVKVRPKTDDHDLDVKTRHIRRFLEEGNKVKVTCRFRGREITHPETAERQLIHFIETTKDIAVIEQTARMEAKTMTILLAPKPEVRARMAALVQKRADEGIAEPPPEPDDEDDDDDDDDEEDEKAEKAPEPAVAAKPEKAEKAPAPAKADGKKK